MKIEISNLKIEKPNKYKKFEISREYYNNQECIQTNIKYYLKTTTQFQYLYSKFILYQNSFDYLVKIRQYKNNNGFDLNIRYANYQSAVAVPFTIQDVFSKKYDNKDDFYVKIATLQFQTASKESLSIFFSILSTIQYNVGIFITSYDYTKKLVHVFEISKTFCSYTIYNNSNHLEKLNLTKYITDGVFDHAPLFKSFSTPILLFPYDLNNCHSIDSNWSSYKFEQRKLHKDI